MIIAPAQECTITATSAERVLVKWLTGKLIANPVEWNDLMPLVSAIEELGYKVLICKYSCSVASAKTNEVIVGNTNADRSLTKKEAVWMAVIEMIKWLKK